jgi:hypothetical protein
VILHFKSVTQAVLCTAPDIGPDVAKLWEGYLARTKDQIGEPSDSR